MQYRLDHIETFVTIVESKSYSEAAKKLHKVRSALTYDVKSLENAIGVALFDRTSYRTSLTKEGERFFSEAKRLLLNAQQVWDFTRQLSTKWEAKIAIVVDGALPFEPILKAVSSLFQKDIPTQVDVRVGFLRGVVETYEKIDADIMVVSEGVSFGSNFTCIELPSIECELVARPEYAVFNEVEVTQERLQRFSEIQVQGVSDSFRYQIGGKHELTVNDFNMKKQSILLGLGFGWMPVQMIAEEKEKGLLKVIPYVNGSSYHLRVSLAVSNGKVLGNAGDILKENLIQEFNKSSKS
jgi:DNA-binding transcriptional LysR family regulator